MYRRDDGKSWLIEVDKSQLPHLSQHLKQYKLRAKINLEPELDKAYRVWSLLCANIEQRDKILAYLLNYPTSSLQLSFHLDPRHPLFLRIILPHDMEVKFPKSVFVDPLQSTETTASSNSIYKWLRTVHGIPEGAFECVSESIPLEMNLDVTDGVHFNKGCYLGQELIARSHHTGVIRKRLLPFILGSDGQHIVVTPDQLVPEGENLYREVEASVVPEINSDIVLANAVEGSDVKAGRVFTTCWNVGFGMCRLEHLSSTAQFQAGPSRLGFIKPSWWSQYTKQQEEVNRSINAL
jgi:folate-binding protein YgfZ